MGHLSDDELIEFFQRSSTLLDREGGLIVVKENVCEGDGVEYDELDGSVTR